MIPHFNISPQRKPAPIVHSLKVISAAERLKTELMLLGLLTFWFRKSDAIRVVAWATGKENL